MSNELTTKAVQDLLASKELSGNQENPGEESPFRYRQSWLEDLLPDAAGFVFRLLPKDLAIDVFGLYGHTSTLVEVLSRLS